MAEMTLSDYAAMRELEHNHKDGWGMTTAVWVIVAVIIVFAFVYIWTKNCNEKVAFATGLARLDGRVDAIEPAVTSQGNNIYKLNGVVASTVQGVKDIKECAYNQLFELNDAVFYNPRRARSCSSGCGNREFEQVQNYTLASTGVTVTERCQN
jgi:hypothetical protein